MAAVEENPLFEQDRLTKNVESCILVIFGATGDLAARKLLPALYNLAKEGELPNHFVCVGVARKEKSHDEFRNEMLDAVTKYSRSKPIDANLWKKFREQLFYQSGDFDNDKTYSSLGAFLNKLDAQFSTKGNRVFYLSTQPSYFPVIIEKLHTNQLAKRTDDQATGWSRVIIEKPFGESLDSAKKLQKEILEHLDESQIYRIDHYLGKETVQNLLVFRFGNSIFESSWNNHHIDNVQISVSEDLGIGTRGRFWEEAGMLRDIVQNHMMQLLSLVAMEPPRNLSADAIHDEKVKVLESIRPLQPNEMEKFAVRGQYGPGYIQGQPVKGYREEDQVPPTSSVETFVALQLYIDNWRWAGIPFFLRAGKRMPKRTTEITIVFKQAPAYLFQHAVKNLDPNVLTIRIQPDEGISLKVACKAPGLNAMILPVKMNFRYSSYFGEAPPEAYERLILDCMSGDKTLFAREDEVMASWKLLTPLSEYWLNTPADNFPNYPAGSWGPQKSEELLRSQGKHWRQLYQAGTI